MSAYDDINKAMDEYEQNVAKNESMTKEEKTKAFFDMATDLFNEHLAGEYTLADGRKVTVPEI